MPRYTYICPECGDKKDIQHAIVMCDTIKIPCYQCEVERTRIIEVPSISGDCVYPFYLNNIRQQKGEKWTPKGLLINNKEEHQSVMKRHKCVTPYLHESKCEDAICGKGDEIYENS